MALVTFVRTFFVAPRTIGVFAQVETDVMILKIFLPKNLAKILAFFAQTADNFCKNLIVFEKNANFFAENWQKSQKIVIITLTLGSYWRRTSKLVYQ
jgi:hypothetical protein